MGAPPLIGIMSHTLGLRTALLLLVAGASVITLLARRGKTFLPPLP